MSGLFGSVLRATSSLSLRLSPSVSAFVEEKEEAPVLDVNAIEVEKKGKKEEEGDESAA